MIRNNRTIGGEHSFSSSIDFQGLLHRYFATTDGLIMAGMLLFLVILSVITGQKKGKLTSGRLAGTAEKLRATNLAIKQIQLKRHQPICLWSGTPRYWLGGQFQPFSARLQTLLGSPPTVWFPHGERGFLVLGAPGSGKTFSVIDRLIESAFCQGMSVIVYDKKGDQVKLHASLATRYGYKVEVLAPGEPYSGVINPLDFMTHYEDTTMAGVIGKVIAANASSGENKGNEFFEKAGEMVAKGLVMLAKQSNYPDLAMVYAFVQLPKFVERIYRAVTRADEFKMNPWIAPCFTQLLSSKNAEKTVAGIKATAEATYTAFIQKDLLRCFVGKSTIPIELKGKQAIFFKLDDERRVVIAPLLAAAIHLCVVKNLAKKRTNPFVYSLDEFPSIKLDDVVYWVNEYRSNGGVPIIGIQALNQLYNTYGDKKGAAIASALSTHVLFNPNDWETAEKYSKRYGETEVLIRSRSTGNSMGQQTSRSINWSEQIHKKPLISPDQIMRFPQGKCVITSPAYGSGDEALFPYPLIIPVSKADKKRAEESEKLWESSIQIQLKNRADYYTKKAGLTDINQALAERIEEAYRMLPLPGEKFDPVTENPDDSIQTTANIPPVLQTQTVENFRSKLSDVKLNLKS